MSGKGERVGVLRDYELVLDEVQDLHTLGGAGEGDT